jgi:DNA ligase-1
MRLFATLVTELGSATKTNDKLDALSRYFRTAGDKDKVWVIALFSGRRPRRAISSGLLIEWCCEWLRLPTWLFTECYHTVGDLAETIALLIPDPPPADSGSQPLFSYIEKLASLQTAADAEKKAFVLDAWRVFNREERFVFNKLITGGFRIGVSQRLMVNALAASLESEPDKLLHLISGNWDPSSTSWDELVHESAAREDVSKPYPFYLAYALEGPPDALGNPEDWQAEWKWDGIRGQLIHRGDQLFVWSRGEELLNGKFPEYEPLLGKLPPSTVLDGEILAFEGGHPLPFSSLQTRIGRKNVTKKQLQEAPVVFVAYDLLEYHGEDLRVKPMERRRALLEDIVSGVNHPALRLSPVIDFHSWEDLAALRSHSRAEHAEGIMLKHKQSTYQAGRRRGDWWKWKIDPLTIDAVMVYAMKGHGRRSNLYTDYTFAVRDGDQLVTFTKAYSGLTDAEIASVDAWVKKNAQEKFGPVRTVPPELVFEIGFEGIAASNRHKSGVALRFPRILRWRKDKPVGEINTLEDLRALLRQYGSAKDNK